VCAGKPVGYFDGASGAASSLAVSGNGQRLISAGNDLSVLLWDIESRQPLASFTLESFPNVCALSADGQVVVVGDRRTVHLLKFETGTSQ
jgi:WD40 repeat protein